jgi:hypothetical protein
VVDVLELLANNVSPEQILADYPDLEPEDIQASLCSPLNGPITLGSWCEVHCRCRATAGLSLTGLTSKCATSGVRPILYSSARSC